MRNPKCRWETRIDPFFITSVGIGDGANNLGGLDGADAHCQTLAAAAGAGNRTWRAYLSTQGPGAVNARGRIGEGPWANAEGLVMATSVENLHYDNSNFNWTHTLDENGNQFASRIDGDPDFSEHDVLTGSQIDGTAFPAGEDRTCGNWTSNDEGSAMLGHADRYSFTTPGSPWNNAHPSRVAHKTVWWRPEGPACTTALPLTNRGDRARDYPD